MAKKPNFPPKPVKGKKPAGKPEGKKPMGKKIC